jgi:hypothetical protein
MSGRHAGVELFRIAALANAFQFHLSGVRGFFNAREHTWQWEYVVIVVCVVGITMMGLFQISPAFSLRSPFRGKGLIVFCLTLMVYAWSIAYVLKSFGFEENCKNFELSYPIVGSISWFVTAHVQLTFMTPILNKGMLALSKRAYLLVDIGILALLAWSGPGGLLTPASAMNWENACMLYVFAGLFGVHGWPFGILITWILFWALFFFLRYCRVVDIFEKISARWQWAFLSFRLTIRPKPNKWLRMEKCCQPYLCPGNYLCGAIAVYAFRTLSFPSGISKTVCFVGNKVFVLHLLDSVTNCFGDTGGAVSPFALSKVLESWRKSNAHLLVYR